MTGLRTIALLLRRLRAERGMVLLVFALVAATTFMLAAAPRLLNHLSDEGLRHELGTALASQRKVQISTVDLPAGRLGANLEAVEAQGAIHEETFPGSLRSLISDRSIAVETVRFEVSNSLRYPSFLTLRYQGGISDQVELVEGRLPASLGGILPGAILGAFRADLPVPEPERFEVAISRPIAETLGIGIGDRLVAHADGNDPMVRFTFEVPIPIELEVVGIYRAIDPAADYWHDDVALQVVNLVGVGDSVLAFASVLIAAEDYPGIAASHLPERFRWRYQLDAERVTASDLDALVADLRRLDGTYRTASTGFIQRGELLLETGLVQIIQRFESKRAASAAVLSVAATGPLGLAAGATAMVAILLVSRRRAALVLTRGRGASGGLLLRTQTLEALLVGGPAAILGFLLASLVPGRSSATSGLLASLALVGAIVLFVGATWPLARRTLGLIEREQPPALRVAPRRLVLELTAIGLAVAGAFLLRQRGLTIADAAGDEAPVRFDPFLAAVPVLIGMAVGLVVVRLYPLPVRALGSLAARRIDLVPVLGLRTVGRHPTIVALPLLVLMLTAAIGAFSSVVVATVDRGQLTASWQEFGADYRVESEGGLTLASAVDPSVVDGVEAVARGYLDPAAVLAIGASDRRTIPLLGVEPAAYRDVTAGSPAQPEWPTAFETAPAAEEDLGTAAQPVPAIVSRRLPRGVPRLEVGSTFEATVQDRPLSFEVVAVRTGFAGLSAGDPFVIVPFTQLASALGAPLQPSVFFVRGPAEIEDALRTTVRQQSPRSRLLSRHAGYAELHDAPLSAAIASGFRLALGVAAAYTALTIVAAVTLTAGRRSRDLAYLRTLGVTARQAFGLIIVEHGPPVAFALAAGVGLGLGVAWLVEPGLALGSFIGPEATVALQIDWTSIGLVSAGLVGVVAVTVVGSTWLARRTDLGQVLRLAEQ
ncbi:MAG TPA: FtsX-like permease family protein [Candidatus Limnocylindria bacterium]|jgi:putative ABC transport system permease protein